MRFAPLRQLISSVITLIATVGVSLTFASGAAALPCASPACDCCPEQGAHRDCCPPPDSNPSSEQDRSSYQARLGVQTFCLPQTCHCSVSVPVSSESRSAKKTVERFSAVIPVFSAAGIVPAALSNRIGSDSALSKAHVNRPLYLLTSRLIC